MARKDTVWTNKPGRYIQTLSPTGYDVLINGTDRYLNFLDVSGSSGYGFRDNAGTMQFKDSVGSWVAFGSGGTGFSGELLDSTSTAIAVVLNGLIISTYFTPAAGFLLQEDGFFILQENGDKIIL